MYSCFSERYHFQPCVMLHFVLNVLTWYKMNDTSYTDYLTHHIVILYCSEASQWNKAELICVCKCISLLYHWDERLDKVKDTWGVCEGVTKMSCQLYNQHEIIIHVRLYISNWYLRRIPGDMLEEFRFLYDGSGPDWLFVLFQQEHYAKQWAFHCLISCIGISILFML